MSARIRALVGLGNPGPEYARQRHNVGFWLVDAIAEQTGTPLREQRKFKGWMGQASVGAQPLWLFEPATYMNRSGEAVRPFLDFYKLEPGEILVAHDDLDLPPGTVRLKHGGGHGGHNGLRDLTRVLGPDYARLRIGIGHPGHKDRVLGYVLSPPSAGEETLILQALARARDALITLGRQGWDKAVQQLHTESAI